MRATRILLGILGVATVASVAVHIPMFLGHHPHGGGGACPFGYSASSTKQAVTRPLVHNPALRGDASAPARPALAFSLGVTTRADVEAYLVHHPRLGGTCHPSGKPSELECTNVALDTGPALQAAWFQFDANGTLDALRTVRHAPSPVVIASTFDDLQTTITAAAGAPATISGSSDPADLSRGALRQAAVEYRFTNYRAVVRATNMGPDYALTEEYASLVD